jgi:hypothetical protein
MAQLQPAPTNCDREWMMRTMIHMDGVDKFQRDRA